MSRGVAERGFTLVEMLIALAIFGMITAAGVALLSVTVRTQETSDRLLDSLGQIRRTGALLTADLAQAAPRPWRDRDGRPQRAFSGASSGANGSGEGELMILVRRGRDDGPEGTGSSLQRVAWRLAGDRLERVALAQVDGAASGIPAPMLAGVTALRLRYRDSDGEWRERWDPTDPARLPRAVELAAETEAHGAVRLLFLVGEGR